MSEGKPNRDGYIPFGEPGATIGVDKKDLSQNPFDGGVLERKDFLFYPSAFEAVKESAENSISEIEDMESRMKDMDPKSQEYKDNMEIYEQKVWVMAKLSRELRWLRIYAMDSMGGQHSRAKFDTKAIFSDHQDFEKFIREVEDFAERVDEYTKEPSWMIQNRGYAKSISAVIEHYKLHIGEIRDLRSMEGDFLRARDASEEEFGGVSREGDVLINLDAYKHWVETGKLETDRKESYKRDGYGQDKTDYIRYGRIGQNGKVRYEKTGVDEND